MKKGILILTIIIGTMLLFDNVKASEVITRWSVIYKNSDRTTSGTSVNVSSNTNISSFTSTKFYWPVNNTNVYEYQGGWIMIPYTLTMPIMSVSPASEIEEEECQRWQKTTINGKETWECVLFSSGTNTITDREYIKPEVSLRADLYTKHNNISYNVPCLVENSYFKCPINYGVDYMDYIDIESNVYYGQSTMTYNISISNHLFIEHDTSQNIIENQNQNTDRIINENATYSDTPSQDITNQTQEAEEYEQEEQNLIGSLNLNATTLDRISINPNASAYIWMIIERLRGINPSIIILMTSILSMGIIKLVLNR